MADWSSYFARLDGAPISVAVDLALQQSAPISEKPAAYTVALSLCEPDEHGMTGAQEYRALAQIEEELLHALEPYGLIEVGRVTGRGMRTFHYYGPGGDIAAAVSGVMRAHDEYVYQAVATSDPLWAIYQNYLYPDAQQLAFANDMKALQALLDAGDDLERERPIVHTVAFTDDASAQNFARTMRDRGYSVSIEDATHAVHCARVEPIDPFKITETRIALTALSEEFGGAYGGWATGIASRNL